MKNSPVIYGLFTLLLAFPEAPPCFASERGKLKLEGKSVKRLILDADGGSREEYDITGEEIELPSGKYRLVEVQLEGDYTHKWWQGENPAELEIISDRTVPLKFGAPLRQCVKAVRQGGCLKLDYELVGIGGETYRIGNRTSPPQFTVYRGEERIGSGEFNYG